MISGRLFSFIVHTFKTAHRGLPVYVYLTVSNIITEFVFVI